MGSEARSTESEATECIGLIPRFLEDLFQELARDEIKPRLEASFLEVYGVDVRDLLDPSRPSLDLHDNINGGGVVCTGLTAKAVVSAKQAVQVLHEGTQNRVTGATLMNSTSSRSHAVFTVTLTRHTKNNDSSNSITTSKLTFVDLAGSECIKKTGAEGERAREGIDINKGLLALGNMISAVADNAGRVQPVFVPHRSSKLTRLLQDALGGNSQTLFLACVSAADSDKSETLNTLQYANRARKIQNAPTRNHVDSSSVVEPVQQWQAYVTVLVAELIRHKFGGGVPSAAAPTGQVDEERMKQKDVIDYLDQLHKLAQRTEVTLQFPATTSPPRDVDATAELQLSLQHDAKLPILENLDQAQLLTNKIHSEEEVAIRDPLLLDGQPPQHQDNYDREQELDGDALKPVEGELILRQGGMNSTSGSIATRSSQQHTPISFSHDPEAMTTSTKAKNQRRPTVASILRTVSKDNDSPAYTEGDVEPAAGSEPVSIDHTNTNDMLLLHTNNTLHHSRLAGYCCPTSQSPESDTRKLSDSLSPDENVSPIAASSVDNQRASLTKEMSSKKMCISLLDDKVTDPATFRFF